MDHNAHVHGVLDFAISKIQNASLLFEYEIAKSWWYSNLSIIDWCQTLSNDVFYSFVIFNIFILISILNNTIYFSRMSLLKKVFIPLKIFYESILIYYILKLSVLYIVYPIGEIISLNKSNFFQFFLLISFLFFYFIILVSIIFAILFLSNLIFKMKN